MSVTWSRGMTKDIDADAELKYSFDWTDWLPSGAAIDSYDITYTDGVTIDQEAINGAGTIVSFRASGVALGARERVTCQIVTDEAVPQTDERSIVLIGVRN